MSDGTTSHAVMPRSCSRWSDHPSLTLLRLRPAWEPTCPTSGTRTHHSDAVALVACQCHPAHASPWLAAFGAIPSAGCFCRHLGDRTVCTTRCGGPGHAATAGCTVRHHCFVAASARGRTGGRCAFEMRAGRGTAASRRAVVCRNDHVVVMQVGDRIRPRTAGRLVRPAPPQTPSRGAASAMQGWC